MILYLLCHIHLPTLMQLNTSQMIPCLHINALDRQILIIGSLTVVLQATILLFSVICMMLNPAMYLFPLLMEPLRYPLSKAQLTVSLQPQKDRKLSLVLLMFTTLKVLATVYFP